MNFSCTYYEKGSLPWCATCSPNTPGLRSLQNRDQLEKLIKAVAEARDNLPGQHKPPLLLKISPDLSVPDMQDIAAVALQGKVGNSCSYYKISINFAQTSPTWPISPIT